MKILIDIGHPAHVHYYRNFIKEMEKRGHEFYIVARNRGVIFDLLRFYNLNFISRGSGRKGIIGKIFYSFYSIFIIARSSFFFKPDVFLSQGGVYTAPVAWIFRKLSVSTEDTENAVVSHKIAKMFNSTIISPSCFQFEISKYHLKYNSYQEFFYLHPNYFKPYSSIRSKLNLNEDEKYVLVRFVDWNAHHDVGHNGLTIDNKIKVVEDLSEFVKVFILSEKSLPENLEKYKIKIDAELMHDVLSEAEMLFGESSTMASECACLGTPAIFIDKKGRGYTDEQEKLYDIVYNFTDSPEDQLKSVAKAIELIKDKDLNQKAKKSHREILKDKIDPTKFLLDYFRELSESGKSKI